MFVVYKEDWSYREITKTFVCCCLNETEAKKVVESNKAIALAMYYNYCPDWVAERLNIRGYVK